MRSTKHLTDEQFHELCSRPLSKEAAEQLCQADREAAWLLPLRLEDGGDDSDEDEGSEG